MSDYSANSDRFLELLGVVYDKCASKADYDELNSLLLAEERLLRRYLSYCRMHAALRLQVRAHRAVHKACQQVGAETHVHIQSAIDVRNAETSSIPPVQDVSATNLWNTVAFLSTGWPMAYLIATVIFAVGAIVGSHTYVSQPANIVLGANAPVTPGAEPKSGMVGRITGLANCKWAGTDHVARDVVLGKTYSLASGLLEISYGTGAKVILEGPCTYKVDSRCGGFLKIGKLTARVESGGGGRVTGGGNAASREWSMAESPLTTNSSHLFCVRTPNAIITDLGTEFGVEVDELGKTTTQVFQGVVELRPDGSGNISSPLRLTANQSASVGSPENSTVEVLRENDDHPKFIRKMPHDRSRATILLSNTGQSVREGGQDARWEIVGASYDPNFKRRPAAVAVVAKRLWAFNEPSRSQWISTGGGDLTAPYNATWTFRTSFDLTGMQPATAKVHGQFIADKHVQAIRINGRNVQVPKHGYNQCDFFHPFVIASGFVEGVNVLEMDVTNGSSSLTPASVQTNADGSVVLFHDDFESTQAASEAAYPDRSGDYNPTGPSVGTWNIHENDEKNVQTIASVVSPDPKAFQGDKCLRLRREVLGVDYAGAAATFVAAATTGDRLRIEQMVYVPAAEQATAEIMQITVGDAINLIANYAGYANDGSVISYTGADGVLHNTGIAFNAGKWQKWRIDYEVGAPSCELTIDGRKASGVPVVGSGKIENVTFHANPFASHPIYIDEVSVCVMGTSVGLRVELEGSAQQCEPGDER